MSVIKCVWVMKEGDLWNWSSGRISVGGIEVAVQ